jgi:fatty acid desaturase
MTGSSEGKPPGLAAFQDIASLREIRGELRDFLGDECVRRVHVQRPWLDLAIVFATLGTFALNLVVLGFFQLNALLTLALVLVQGWLITLMGLICHDVFVHRMMFRGKLGHLLASLLFIPATVPFTKYRIGHLRHHAHIGTEADTERYKQDLNTGWRRILFTTVFGFKAATSGRWSSQTEHGYQGLIGADTGEARSAKLEMLGVLAMVIAVLAISVFYSWKIFVFGWLLPVLLVAPLLNTARIIIEHAHVDPENKYWLATPYKTGVFSKVIFLADSGDCHILHHIFPRVPWYGMAELVRASAPFFRERGVVYEGGYLRLLKGWFIDVYPHRSKWVL